MTVELSPEEAVLVAAVAGEPSSGRRGAGSDRSGDRQASAAGTPASGPGLDWHRLLELAAWHRVLPLLWQHLSGPVPGLVVPAAVHDELRRLTREATARGLHLQAELVRVVEALAAEHIDVVLLKGAALVELVYDHVGLRPMGDLDLLVRRTEVARAHAVVQALGYEVRGTKVRARDDAAWLAEIHHHLPLVEPRSGVVVELHHRILVDRPGWDVEGVWARAVASEGPAPHLLPAPEDLLLHVAAHFTLDRMNRERSALGQLADVVHLVRRCPVDWTAVVDRAREAAVADRLFVALAAAEVLVGAVAPPTVMETLAPASYTRRRVEQLVRQRVLPAGASLPLEQLAGGRRRLFGAHTLEVYVRPDDVVVPSRMRLRTRRFASIARRAGRLATSPRALVDDIRLTRWMLRLRR